MRPDEKIVDIVVEDGRRMRVVMLFPDCTACRHFDYLQKTGLFGDTEEVPWCRRKEAAVNPDDPCEDFE